MLRVLVVDDSPVARNLLVEILNGEPDIEVVGEAHNGQQAVEQVARLKPDLVTMDIQMPRMDGYAATRAIMTSHPTPIVVVSGTAGKSDKEKSMLSLAAGALTVIGKPASPASPDFSKSAAALANTVRTMAAVQVIRRHRPRDMPAILSSHQTSSTQIELKARPKLIAIAASTGGPQALQTVLSALPRDFPIPIVIVQHISHGFTDGLADCLDHALDLDVTIAEDAQQLRPGHVYVAPEKRHCGFRGNGTLELLDTPAVGGFCPSASVLFESAGQAYGAAHVAVVLTGMGDDGVDGLKAAKGAQGVVIAQDEDSCVVFGMPKAVVDAGLADLILPIEQIGPELVRLAR